jgi:hypothetical protein
MENGVKKPTLSNSLQPTACNLYPYLVMQMKEIINAESKKHYPEGPECPFFEELWYSPYK